MSSGTYFPPLVKVVEIPKKNGYIRVLDIPRVSDRIAKMVVKPAFESKVEKHTQDENAYIEFFHSSIKKEEIYGNI